MDCKKFNPGFKNWVHPIFNLFQSLKAKNEFGAEPIDQQMDPEQSGFNSAYHQRLSSIINEAIRNNYIWLFFINYKAISLDFKRGAVQT